MSPSFPWPKQNRAAMNAFYGNPDEDNNGTPDRHWEVTNLARFTPPYPMYLAWATDKRVKSILCHKRVCDSLLRVLTEIGKHTSEIERAKTGLDKYGGVYNFRLMRGGSQLSIHSWGAAIDISPTLNAFGKRNPPMPIVAINAFSAEGWAWGGRWRKPDGMHFQAAQV